MFGAYRFLLALIVSLSHGNSNLVPSGGTYAVYGFYLLSGYLMTLVLHRTYGFSARGVVRFLANRALRIYPPYLIAVAVAVLVVGGSFHGNPVAVRIADLSWRSQLSELLLVDLTGGAPRARWLPQSWSLEVEIVFYLAMALLLARWRPLILVWFVASLGYGVFLAVTGSGLVFFSPTLAAASLPFSAGSVLYAYSAVFPAATPWRAGVAIVAFVANMEFASYIWPRPFVDGFNASLVIAFLVTVFLRDPDRLGFSPRVRAVDARLGDLAYPVFLCQHNVLVLARRMVPADLPWRPAVVLVASLALTILAASVLHRAVETPLDRVRERLRRRGTEASPESPLRHTGAPVGDQVLAGKRLGVTP